MIRRLYNRLILYPYYIRRQNASCRLYLGRPLSLLDKAVLFTDSMFQWASEGFVRSPEAVVRRRLAICFRHPECWRLRAGIRYCARCGCTSLKHRVPAARCPRGFW